MQKLILFDMTFTAFSQNWQIAQFILNYSRRHRKNKSNIQLDVLLLTTLKNTLAKSILQKC